MIGEALIGIGGGFLSINLPSVGGGSAVFEVQVSAYSYSRLCGRDIQNIATESPYYFDTMHVEYNLSAPSIFLQGISTSSSLIVEEIMLSTLSLSLEVL